MSDGEQMTRIARFAIAQLEEELAREDPVYAAERKQHEAEMKAWRRERDQLCSEIVRAQIPFVIAVAHKSDVIGEAAASVLQVSDFLYQQDAPAKLIRNFLRALTPLVRGAE